MLSTLFFLVGFSQAAEAQTYETLRLVFEKDAISLSRDELRARLTTECEQGSAVACTHPRWLEDNRIDEASLSGELLRACDAAESWACLAQTWADEPRLAAMDDLEERDKRWRSMARVRKTLCDNGLIDACFDYATMLHENMGFQADPRAAKARWTSACDAGQWPSCVQLARLRNDVSLAARACDNGHVDGCFVRVQLSDGAFSVAEQAALLSPMCDAGHGQACWRAADSLHNDGDDAAAHPLYEKSCDLNHSRACFHVGQHHQQAHEMNAAAARYEWGCGLGDNAACNARVHLALAGHVDPGAGAYPRAFEVACDDNHNGTACRELAFELLDGVSMSRDATRARALLERVCTQPGDDASACYRLGRLYEAGVGGERDRTLASNVYKRACEADHYASCARRGDLLVSDVGVRRDDLEALSNYRRACHGKLGSACHDAAEIVYHGTLIDRDLDAAEQLYASGCDLQDAPSCVGLGVLHETRSSPDYKAARAAYEQSVELDFPEAKRRLARLLWLGKGGGSARHRAKNLCREACQQGDAAACRGPAFL